MPAVANEQKHYNRFAMAETRSLLEAPDLGIINGRLHGRILDIWAGRGQYRITCIPSD